MSYVIILYTDEDCDHRDLSCVDIKIINDLKEDLDQYFIDNAKKLMKWLGVLYWNDRNNEIVDKLFFKEYVEKYSCFENKEEGELELWIVENREEIRSIFQESKFLKIVKIK